MTIPRIVDALRRGLASVERFAGEPVTYQRGEATAEIRATRGDKSATDVETGNETSVQGMRVDWIVTAEQLEPDTGLIEPGEGDIIIDAGEVKYRVTKHPLDGLAARWMEHRLAMRIHCIIVEGE